LSAGQRYDGVAATLKTLILKMPGDSHLKDAILFLAKQKRQIGNMDQPYHQSALSYHMNNEIFH
jgi:hypothetical protein